MLPLITRLRRRADRKGRPPLGATGAAPPAGVPQVAAADAVPAQNTAAFFRTCLMLPLITRLRSRRSEGPSADAPLFWGTLL
jgi:hypothetical protein